MTAAWDAGAAAGAAAAAATSTANVDQVSEQAVVAAVLASRSVPSAITGVVSGGDFANVTLGAIFEAAATVAKESKPVTILAVREQLARLGTVRLAEKDLVALLEGLLSPSWAAIDEAELLAHARHVATRRTHRDGATIAQEVAARLDEGDVAVAGSRTDALHRYVGVLQSGEPTLPPRVDAILRSDEFASPQNTFPTGFAELDDLIAGGVKARQLTVIAAPTGSGKTGFVGVIALTIARDDSVPILWAATEIDEAEQAARFAGIGMSGSPDDFLSLRRSPEDAANVLDLAIHILELDTFTIPDPINEIERAARSIASATGQMPVIVVDYLQQLAVDDPDRRRVSVSGVANGLRRLAQRLATPVIAISSVSRAYYGKARGDLAREEDPRAWLATAKESGDIEFAAAVFAYLDTDTNVDEWGWSNARLILAKSRRGRTGFVGLRFHGPSGRFEPNAVSLVKMGAAQRGAADDDKVVATVAGTREAPKPWSALRDKCGLSVGRADASRDRLLNAARITKRSVRVPNEQGRPRHVDWIVLPDWLSDRLPIGVALSLPSSAAKGKEANAPQAAGQHNTPAADVASQPSAAQTPPAESSEGGGI